MSKELVIGSNRHETKVAVLEEDQLTEIYFQRANEYSLAGSIHKGRVTRVLPGMQSAFVDLGLERDTFLYVSDFFEENEDIDTVTEEKGSGRSNDRGERRDRGTGNRGSERSASEWSPAEGAPVIVPEVAAPVAVIQLLTPLNVQEPIEEVVVVTTAPAPSVEPAESKPGDRPDGDKGFRGGDRGGDRRGRRSRRRRSRGGGFPDNKYAQPGAASSETAARQPLSTGTPASVEEEEVDAEALDVIILPGESLAKYRRLSAEPEPEHEAAAEAEAAAESETTPSHVSPSENREGAERSEGAESAQSEAEERAEIAERAEELELADKVLGHHPEDEQPEEEDEKIAAVEADVPSSPFVVDDVHADEVDADDSGAAEAGEPEAGEIRQAEFRSEAPVEALRHPLVYVFEEQESLEEDRPTFAFRERIDESTSSHAVVEFPGEVPEEEGLSGSELTEEEILAGRVGSGEEDFEGADLEDSPETSFPGDGRDVGEARPQEASSTARTGVGREPNEQYQQRSSRRMRRRRGGNRFSQQNAGDSAAAAPPISGGLGTAMAVQPEVRSESPRQVSDERPAERPERVMPSISELLKPGQEIIVQIAKEPLGQKGARITSHIALPGRYVVFMPSVGHLGVSRKIASDEERQRLKRILQAHRPGATGGFIVRTAGEGIPEAEIAADMEFLYKLWTDIRQKAEKKPAPALLHYDLDIVQRILRDQVTEEFKAIWVDSEEMYEHVLSFTQRFQPTLVSRVKMYTRSAPIFDAFGITQELEKALRPKVWLKSGGYIVINQTEALVAIDINTGKYVGKSNRLEDTIAKTNIEAVKEIVRQIRLRDLGGIIVVDFIDMDERKNRQRVMQTLEEAMEADKAPYKILQFNDFGLVAITRKRVKQSLERTLCAPCPYCEGAGYVKSVQTIISEILVEAQKIAKAIEGKDVMLRVHPDVAKVLKANDNKYLEELEEILRRPVLVKSDPALHHEKFDLG